MRSFRWMLLIAGLLLEACGGGGTGPSSGAPPPGSPPGPSQPGNGAQGNVLVTVMTPTGPPSGALVKIYGASFLNTGRTDAAGQARFTAPVGEASVAAAVDGFAPGFSSVTVSSAGRAGTTIFIAQSARAIPIFAVRNVSLTGTTLAFDVEFSVLDERGEPVETLTAADVEMYYPECLVNDVCWAYADGRDLAGDYGVKTGPTDFTFVPARTRSPFIASLLLEHTPPVVDFLGYRTLPEAAKAFLDSVMPGNLVTLGIYQGQGGSPGLMTYGGFVADGTTFRPVLDGLSDPEFGANPVLAAVSDMLTFTSANAPTTAAPAQRALVVLSPSPPVTTCNSLTCNPLAASVAKSRQLGFPVFAVSRDLTSRSLAQLVMGSGGRFIDVDGPAQYRTVATALGSIIGGGLPYYRMHIELVARNADLDSGNAALVYLVLRRPERLDMYIPVPIP